MLVSGFGVHHDRRGGSARLDGEALRRASAVHARPGGRAGTLLLQLVIHQRIKLLMSHSFKGSNSVRRNMSTRER